MRRWSSCLGPVVATVARRARWGRDWTVRLACRRGWLRHEPAGRSCRGGRGGSCECPESGSERAGQRAGVATMGQWLTARPEAACRDWRCRWLRTPVGTTQRRMSLPWPLPSKQSSWPGCETVRVHWRAGRDLRSSAAPRLAGVWWRTFESVVPAAATPPSRSCRRCRATRRTGFCGRTTNWILRENTETAWLVDANGDLGWIKGGGIYQCLAQKYYVRDNTPRSEITVFEADVYSGDAACL